MFPRTLLSVLFVAVLFFTSTSFAHAATGDIKAVRILGDTVHNGWTAEIDIEGLAIGGKYNTGISTSTKNSPDAAKVVFTITSPGFDTEGNAITTTRTVYGTKFVRLPYPNNLKADETVATTTNENGVITTVLTTKVALSDFVYAEDTNITAAIAPNFYTSASSTNAAATIAVVNNSVLTYPKSIGRWAWPGYERVTTDFPVEAVIFNRFAKNGLPVAAVTFTATDEHGNTSVAWATTPTPSARTGDANTVLVYAATMPVATLTQGDRITTTFTAYPWVGTNASILDASVGLDGVAQPDERLGPLTQVLDKNGTYGVGYALVDPLGKVGTSTGAVVYASKEAAEAAGVSTAFTTIGRAADAIKAYHTNNFARASAGGGVILLNPGSYAYPGYAPKDLGVMNIWLTIRPSTLGSTSTVTLGVGTNAVLNAEKVKIEGVTIGVGSTTGTILKGRTATDLLWLHNNTLNIGSSAGVYSYRTVYATQNIVTVMNGTKGFGFYSSYKSPYALVRGNSASTPVSAVLYAVLGNKNIYVGSTHFIEAGNTQGQQVSDNAVYAYNTLYAINKAAGAAWANFSPITKGIAFVQNVWESLSTTQPLLQIAADSSTSTVSNVLVWNNTFAGERQNFGYNEYNNQAGLRTNWSQKFNIFKQWNVKTDTFAAGPANPVRVNNWAIVYNVGSEGNVAKEVNFRGEFDGLYSQFPTNPGFVSDQSSTGTKIGGGNYKLLGTSPVLSLSNLIPSSHRVLPADLAGSLTGSATLGAYAQ